MLKTRILTAALLVPAVLAALFLLTPPAWAGVSLVVVGLAACEWARLTQMTGARLLVVVGGVVGLGLFLLLAPAAQFARGWPDAIVYAVCGGASVFWFLVATPWVMRRWPMRPPALMTLVGWGVLVATWMALVELQARSPWLVLAAMAIVWIADTAAYFSGRAFGRHKLAPQVSPGKTWEGVYGAWVAVALYAYVLSFFAHDAGYRGPVSPVAVALWILFALVLASISVLGDLFESLMKRQANMKDSGTLLPGHGGILDRIDALLAAMPLAAVATHAFLVRP